MLRSRAKSQAMAHPPIQVRGISTGLGQWSAAKIVPAIREAPAGRISAARSRLVTQEFNPTCWSKQKNIYPKKRFGTSTWLTGRCDPPRKSPTMHRPIPKGSRTTTDFFMAIHKLSIRQPRVLGLSLCRTKLTMSQAGNKNQEYLY